MKIPVFFIVFFNFLLCAYGQTNFSGNVLDAFDKKYLEGVTVSITGGDEVMTNARGYFSLKGAEGDTLKLSFPGFIDREIVLGEDHFLLLQIQDRARLLPTFQVDAQPYRYRFKDGKLYLAEDEPEYVKRLSSGVSAGAANNADLTPGFAIYGVLSSLTKRNRELRQYEERLEWIKRRQGYLEVIDSEELRTELMENYQLTREAWDQLIIRFNAFHLEHEFLDWPKARVDASLREFIRIEAYLDY
ncbi:hypothetical protein GCM10009119_33030 [Algoriphagus jejuensis]|uniref:Carboxypeptidase-like protein n=1 Tax=Algoriphagus jejuensis TaxID=419934 RepID=A0ABP3YFY3_9BACT